MPTIKLYDLRGDLTGRKPIVCEIHNLGEWLLFHYGQVPNVSVQVFEGEPSFETDITRDVAAQMRSNAPLYTVLQSPGGSSVSKVLSVFLPFWGGSVLAGQAAVNALMPNIPINSLANSRGGSPNNELSDRTNRARIMQRVEDIYGTVRAFPSLMMPTYTKWINHVQYEYGYYCVGRGYYSITDVRDGETPLAEIPGARLAAFNPFTSPNSGDAPVYSIGGAIEDDIVTVKRSNEIDGATLKPLNLIQLPDTDQYAYIPNATGDIIRQATKRPEFGSIFGAGDTITVTMTPLNRGSVSGTNISAANADNSFNTTGSFDGLRLQNGHSITVTGNNPGTYTVVSFTSTKIVVSGGTLTTTPAGASVTITNNTKINYSGNYEIASVNNDEIKLTTATWDVEINSSWITIETTVKKDGVREWTAWVTLSEADREQVWANVVAINGMYKDKGEGKRTTSVTVEMQIEQLDSNLDPTGTVETVSESISGATSDGRAATLETVTSFTGPCRVRARRVTPHDYDYDGAVVDEVKFADLYSVSPVTQTHFGNLFTLQTVTKATLRALAAKERQLNCLPSRLLPTYNGSTFSGAFDNEGRHISGTISTTSRFVDIMAAVSVDPVIGGRDLVTEVDMPQIYAVYQQIAAWGPEYAEFNYTLDESNLSYEETIRMIANACFCVAYRQSGKIRFSFDRAQTSPVVPTFCHRNKKPNSETVSRNFAADSDWDGIELVYMDPDTERNETIKLPLDLSATKYKKVEIPGIRSFAQAWMRANREYEKLRNQRMAIETTATTDARALLPNTRIDVVDDTKFKRYGGEVLAVDGLTLTLSQPVTFTPGEPHSILLKKRNGDSEGITVTAGSSTHQVVLAHEPSEPVVTEQGENGIRTIYSFASDSQRLKQAWLVQEVIPQDKQYVQIRAINYSDAYYQHDYEPIPDKDTVIKS